MSILLPQQLLSATLEASINKAILLHQGGLLPLADLDQQVLAIVLAELGFSIVFTFMDNKVYVGNSIERASCTIKTSIATLVELKKNQQLTALIKQDKLDIVGDSKVAQKFITLLETINIDWQSEIAKHIGDIPTHKLDRVRQNLFQKVAFASEQIQADMSEYIVHEKRLVVTTSEIKRFNQQVTIVSENADELIARLTKLERAIQNNKAQ